MAYTQRGPAASSMDSLIEISDPEEMRSISDDALREQEANNRRLAQAVNYMQLEGHPDSGMTYMDRVERIDEALLEQLPLQGQNYDTKLYRQLRALVLEAKREYSEAIHGDSSRNEIYEYPSLQYAPPSFEEALYRGDSEPPSPTPAPARKALTRKTLNPRRGGKDDTVDRIRHFKYGGSRTEPENWHKDFPAILPFPETLMMAHWESLKMDYDLARPKDSKIVETNVPLDHPALEQYFNLPLYESGSRFKLPSVSEDLQAEISRYGTGDRIREVLDEYYALDAYDVGDYAPRLFLEEFKVGTQMPPNTVSPSRVRRALASTPTRPRSTILRRASFSNAGPPSRIETTPRSASRGPQRVSPAFRRISSEVRASVAEKERIEPATAARSASKAAPTSKVASHVAAAKRGPGRPPRSVVPAAAKATPAPAAVKSTTSSRRKPSIGSQLYVLPPESPVEPVVKSYISKRKLSHGSQPYLTPQQILETPRKKRKSTPGKSVNFAVPSDEDTESAEEIHVITSLAKFDTPTSSSKKGKTAVKGKAPARAQAVEPVAGTSWSDHDAHVVTSRYKLDGSPPSSSKKSKVTKKTSKAAAAGKLVKKRNEAKAKVAEKTVRTTRSGASYTV